MVSVAEDVGTGMIGVCAEIAAVPGGGLETDLVVTLSTMDGTKAGLQCWQHQYFLMAHCTGSLFPGHSGLLACSM